MGCRFEMGLLVAMSLIRIPAFTALDAIALNITLTTAVRTNPQQLLHCVRGEPNLVPFAWYVGHVGLEAWLIERYLGH